MSPTMWAWAAAFGLTLLIEVPIVLGILRGQAVWPRLLLIAVGAQLITHPALWFVAPRFEPYWAWLVVMELLVTAVEAALYAGLIRTTVPTWTRPLVLGIAASLAANVTSTGVGLGLRALGWM